MVLKAHQQGRLLTLTIDSPASNNALDAVLLDALGHALDRAERTVEVDGRPIRVKLGLLDDEVVNAMPEWEDVAAAAASLGRPAKQVLRDAHAAARHLQPDRPPSRAGS